MNPTASDWFPVIRVFADASGTTHVEDGEIALHDAGEIGALSAPIESARVLLRRNHASYDYDWHPSPARQLILLLTGTIELETGDGERRRIGPGNTLLLEDVTGRGHRTRNVGGAPRLTAFIQTDDDLEYRPRSVHE